MITLAMKTASKALGSVLCLTLLLTSCAGRPIHERNTPETEAAKLALIITEYTEAAKRLDAFDASYFDIEEDLEKFGDYLSPEWLARAKKMVETALTKVRLVDASKLSGANLTAYRLFKQNMEIEMREFDFPSEYLSFNQMGNRLHSYMDDTSEALTSFPFDSVKHYRAFLKRSEGFPAFVDRQITNLKEGVKKGIVLNCINAKSALGTYQDALTKEIEKNPFFRPVTFMPKTFSETDRASLDADFRTMIRDRIIPGYSKFDQYYRGEYLSKCRKSFGIGSLPNGKAWYAHSIEASTDLPLTAKDVHVMGLKEVARIEKELVKVKNELGFKGSMKAFRKSLRDDPKYFFTSTKDMFHAFEEVKAKVSAKIPEFFALIPKSDYKIVETSNPADAAGSYRSPTESQPFGRFIVNTKNLKSVPIYEVTTLSMHEAVPGHHFQLALLFEMKDQLSEYQRKIFFSNSFAEGWALYAERLGFEMGMYNDPMQKLGTLNDEMWRAVRLVVDSGIHAYGWSQKKAIAYMQNHIASDTASVTIEVNRYATWPGQALSYKVGQLKILELRHLAEKELGPKFNVKDFHRAVIGNGTVSLPVLDTQVREWIASVNKPRP